MKKHSMIQYAGKTVIAALCLGMVFAAGCKEKQEKADAGTATAKKAPGAREEAAKMPPPPVSLDPAVVLVDVDGKKLTVKEADEQVRPMLEANAGNLDPNMLAQLMPRFHQQAVQRFVLRTILTAEADRKQVKATDTDVDEAIAMIKTRLPPSMTLEDALKKEGLTIEKLRENLSTEVRFKKLIDTEVPTNVAPSAEEVAKYYEANKSRFVTPASVEARHILLKVNEGDAADKKDQQKTKAEGLRKQLVDGADFEKLARENSDCPSKANGGSLGTFGRGQMVKPFEDAAFTQPVKEIGPVVETIFGYHIIQVLNRNAAKTNSLDDVKDKLADGLKQQTHMKAVDKYLAALTAKANIVYHESMKPMSATMPESEPEEAGEAE